MSDSARLVYVMRRHAAVILGGALIGAAIGWSFTGLLIGAAIGSLPVAAYVLRRVLRAVLVFLVGTFMYHSWPEWRALIDRKVAADQAAEEAMRHVR